MSNENVFNVPPTVCDGVSSPGKHNSLFAGMSFIGSPSSRFAISDKSRARGERLLAEAKVRRDAQNSKAPQSHLVEDEITTLRRELRAAKRHCWSLPALLSRYGSSEHGFVEWADIDAFDFSKKDGEEVRAPRPLTRARSPAPRAHAPAHRLARRAAHRGRARRVDGAPRRAQDDV